MSVPIADAGFIVAYGGRHAVQRKWAREAFRKYGAPFRTWEGAIIEAAHFCSPDLITRMVRDGDFLIDFTLAGQIHVVNLLLKKYADQEMDLTDACIVRMSELIPDCLVFTVDHDFDVYRRFNDQLIPTNYPPRD